MKSPLPSRPEAWQRLVAAQPADWVLKHCRCVEGLACVMADAAIRAGHDVDADLVARGALLHDIGRSISHGLDHAYLGADLLRQPPPVPEPLARIVETHTGAGIAPEDAQAALLPERDFIPRSLEEKIVAHADNLYSGEKRQSLEHVEAKYVAKGLPRAAQAIVRLHDELSGLLDADLDALQPTVLPDP